MGVSDVGSDMHSYMQSVAALDAADDGMRKALRLLAAQQQRHLDPHSVSRPTSRSTLSDTTLSGYRCVTEPRTVRRDGASRTMRHHHAARTLVDPSARALCSAVSQHSCMFACA